MERLELGLLGGFELRRDGRILPPLTLRAARSLFAYLVLNRDRSHTRDLLAGTFWPDFDEARARRRLSQALWQIQKVLGEEDGQRYIIGTADTVRFNPGADFSLDVDEFLGAVDDAADVGRDGEIAALERAVGLYRGDLLAGFYDDWLFHDQDRLRTRFLSALERLADLTIARGDYETALSYARRLAQESEFDEEAHRRVMRVAVLLGRHNEALRQFEECRRILAEELGAEPSAETIDLYEATLADRDAGGRGAPTHEEFPLFGESDATPFVGREAERSTFAERLDEVLEGKSRIVLVEGESGVGKTRLLREVAADAQWRGMDVIWGRSTPAGGRPFGPIGEALRTGLSDLRLRQMQNRLDAARISALAPLIPRLAASAAPEVAMGMADEQARTYEAIGAAFQALAATSPTLVVLEDMHWADEDTLQALEQIANRVGRERIVFAVTYRHGEARERPEVWNMLRSLDRLEYCERMSLATLTPAQTEDLIRRSLGRSEVSGGFSERLHRDTGGVPLFILETLRAMYERDSLSEAEEPSEEVGSSRERLPISPTVHALMRGRLQSLEGAPRRLLELIAAHDGTLMLQEVVQATELDETTALAVLDELASRRFIGSTDDRFHVDHDLLRRVLYEELPASRRLDLHRRVASAVEAHRPEEVELLAHHFVAARIPDKAARYLELAAERATAAHAFDRAAHYWALASVALDEIGAANDRKYAVAASHEQVLDVLGRRSDQEAVLNRMARFAAADDESDVLRRKAWWLAHQDRVAEAAQTARSSLEVATAASDAGRIVQAATALGMICCFVGQAADGVQHLERVVDIRDSDPRQLADARNALGHNLIDLQRFDQAKSHLLAALGLYEELGDARGQAEVLGTLATMRMERGDPDSAESDFLRAIEISERIGYLHGAAVHRMNLGILFVITNRVGSAIQAFAQAEAAYRAMGNQRGRALVLSNSAWLLHGLVGADDAALKKIKEAISIYESIGDERGIAQCEGLLGSVCGRRHELDQAEQLFMQSIERTQRLGDSWLQAQTLREFASAELENGAIESGIAHVLEAEAIASEFGMNDLLVGVRALAARLLLRGDRLEEAFDRASTAMRELRKGVEFAHLVPFAMSEVHDAAGNRDDATRCVGEAWKQLSEMLHDLDPDLQRESWQRVPSHAAIRVRFAATAPRTIEFRLPAIDAPLGRSLSPADTLPVTLTVQASDDELVEDRIDRRRRQLVRVVEQARSQGATATIADLAVILDSSEATVRRDLAALRESGAEIVTRGSR